jgi:hypothetical protein
MEMFEDQGRDGRTRFCGRTNQQDPTVIVDDDHDVEKQIKFSPNNFKGKDHFRDLLKKWGDNIKMDPMEIQYEEDWILLA